MQVGAHKVLDLARFEPPDRPTERPTDERRSPQNSIAQLVSFGGTTISSKYLV